MQVEQERAVGEPIQAEIGYVEGLRPQMEQVFRIMAHEVPEHLLHSVRVAEIARLIAEAAGYDEEHQLRIFHEALPHDVGKIFTPKNVLYKPDRLTPEEYAEVKRHPKDGAWLLQMMNFNTGHMAVAQEHQRYNNRFGYPEDINPQDVSSDSRIVMTADVHDAILDPRRPNNTSSVNIDDCRSTMAQYFAEGKLYPEMRPFYDALISTSEFRFLKETGATAEDVAYFFEMRALDFIGRNNIVGTDMQNILRRIIDMDYALFADARKQAIPIDSELID